MTELRTVLSYKVLLEHERNDVGTLIGKEVPGTKENHFLVQIFEDRDRNGGYFEYRNFPGRRLDFSVLFGK